MLCAVCSAGIGRTGCFIAISIAIHQLRREHAVDILAIVANLRLDRLPLASSSVVILVFVCCDAIAIVNSVCLSVRHAFPVKYVVKFVCITIAPYVILVFLPTSHCRKF